MRPDVIWCLCVCVHVCFRVGVCACVRVCTSCKHGDLTDACMSDNLHVQECVKHVSIKANRKQYNVIVFVIVSGACCYMACQCHEFYGYVSPFYT